MFVNHKNKFPLKQEITRPKLMLQKKAVDWFFEISALFCIIFMWAYSFYNYSTLPNTIATHFNISGQPDVYGSKSTIFLLPLITTILVFVLRILNRYPHHFNYPTAITVENAERQYSMATRLMRYLQFIISALFTYIVVKTVQDAHLQQSKLSVYFLLFLMPAIMVPTVYTVYISLIKK